MPTPHESVAALPVGADANKQLLRDLLFERMAYVMTTAENHGDFVETDPASGAVTQALIKNGKIYYLDPLDAVTADDGITCLVTSGGKRYKLEDFVAPFSVLDKDLTAPPSPAASIGDAYLLVAPGTGDWTGLGPVVVLTSQGWVSVDPPVGFLIYVEDEDAYYHVDAGGNVQSGIGISSIADESLMPRHLLGNGDLVFFIVENQTTTVPPSSPAPSEGVTYIAGTAASGAWTGWDESIVRFESGVWKRYAPAEGWRAFDRDDDQVYTFDGLNWVGASNIEVFATPGSFSWTKPAVGSVLDAFIWGGGQSGACRATTGNASGGHGGGFTWTRIPLSRLPAALDLVVGAGGAAVPSSNANGNVGALSSIGVSTRIFTNTTTGGANTNAGGGTPTTGGSGGGGRTSDGVGSSGTGTSTAPVDVLGHSIGAGGGAGGSTSGSTAGAGGNAAMGGGGGGARTAGNATNGGLSIGGGRGGNSSVSGAVEDGEQPGGGGAGAANGNASGKGGDGMIIMIVS